MRKTGNYGWWASGALTVALLAVPALVIWSQNAQASSGFNCRNDAYVSGGKCDLRRIAIDTLIHYYNINKSRPDRNYGCNWYRTLRAFNSSGKWNYANHDSTVSTIRNGNPAPDMTNAPLNLKNGNCRYDEPMTTAEAQANRRNWSGWGPVASWLAVENGREKTKTCPGGGTILESQQCPEPPEMLTCWDGSQIRYQPAVWEIEGRPDSQAREAQRRADCPPESVVKPTITLSVGPDVTEGKAHTWTLHASEPTHVDLAIRVDFRAVGELMGRAGRYYAAMFGRVGFKRLGGGLAEAYQGGQHFTLPAGQTSVSFTGMGSSNDFRHTGDGTVTGIVGAGQGYVLGTPSSVSAKVLDDDDEVASTVPINMPTVTVREGKWATVRITTPSQEGERRCVTGRVTLTPASGGQPDSSDYRTYFLDREITFCSSIRGQAFFGYVQAYRDSHDDNGERLILGFTQTGGDAELVVNEGSVTITNDGPLPAEWLARVGHGVAGQVVESVATRVFSNRSPGEVEGSLGAMPTEDNPVTDGDALLTGSSASMTSHDGALAMWARADGTSFSIMTGGDGDVTTGHAGVDYVDGPLMFGLALARSEAEGSYRGGGSNDLYHLESNLTAVYPYTALKLGPGTVWAAAGYGEGEGSLSREGDDVLKDATADIDWRMAAAGFRVGLREAEDYSLDLVGDAFWQGIDSGKTPHHEASSSESTRVRGGVEGGLALGPLTLSPRALLRWDGGDVDDDRSVELGGGLAWAVTDALEVRLDGSEAMDSGSGWTSWAAGMSLATGAGTVSTNYARDGSYTLGWGMTFDGGSVGFEAEPEADRVSGTMSLRF